MSAAQSGSDEAPPGPSGRGTREQLVAAASRLLAEGGVGAVTLRAVGERAGVSRSAPYRHFEDKNDLLVAVLLETFRKFFQDMEAEMSATPMTTPEMLRRGFRGYVRFGLAWPEHYLLMFSDRKVHVDKGDLAEVAPKGLDFFQEIITKGQRAGELRSGDAREMTLLTWSALHGLVTLGVSDHLKSKGVDTEEALDRLVAELVAGLEA
ncbi:TetR/AcrR family transcriptional regulator [Halostreptopolyspora alba]|uniref:TetR/AcrR family transcriptional regulator n=1 Tax=Halostreptopolyspora alba TaxID=2487137 RepID=A0A3N0EF42_9ACTN|nr:TetR/AcrR family transcriptional regulator [Nocardiopsaceae bacterium YIM 96095]